MRVGAVVEDRGEAGELDTGWPGFKWSSWVSLKFASM
jgi:hypothetical protein